jgi:hypothetical protein
MGWEEPYTTTAQNLERVFHDIVPATIRNQREVKEWITKFQAFLVDFHPYESCYIFFVFNFPEFYEQHFFYSQL